jgi:hypothetical protein
MYGPGDLKQIDDAALQVPERLILHHTLLDQQILMAYPFIITR